MGSLYRLMMAVLFSAEMALLCNIYLMLQFSGSAI